MSFEQLTGLFGCEDKKNEHCFKKKDDSSWLKHFSLDWNVSDEKCAHYHSYIQRWWHEHAYFADCSSVPFNRLDLGWQKHAEVSQLTAFSGCSGHKWHHK